MAHLLLVDPDAEHIRELQTLFASQDWSVWSADSLTAARAELEREAIDLIVAELDVPGGSGLDLIEDARRQPWAPEVVVLTRIHDPEIAESAIRMGGWDFLVRPVTDQQVVMTVKRALMYREEKRKARTRMVLDTKGIVGRSPAMMERYHAIAQAAQSDISVLISGETGTGKELFARAIHHNSDRSAENFVVVDCTVLPENLVESVLFGHRKGAFTGAVDSRRGLVAQAHRGTLFLDEIGELPLSIQSSFLRVLQERKYRPVGAQQEQFCDFRLIAASNRDLKEEVRAGRFREDLLYRLQGFSIHIPSLRDHKEDIRDLVLHYSEKISRRMEIPEKTFSHDFFDTLLAYDWPGNIRELIRAVESAMASGKRERVLFSKHLPTALHAASLRQQLERQQEDDLALSLESLDHGETFPSLKEVRDQALAKVESQYLHALLNRTDRDIDLACDVADISRSRFYALLKKYGISGKRS